MIVQVAARGRVKKILREPRDMIMLWRIAVSVISPRTRPIASGAKGIWSFLNAYPTTPKKSISQTSNSRLLTA